MINPQQSQHPYNPQSNGHSTPQPGQKNSVYQKQPSESYSMGPNTGNLMPPHNSVPHHGQSGIPLLQSILLQSGILVLYYISVLYLFLITND
jgi:hypothetical protein